MTRKNDSPQKAAMRQMMQDYLKSNDIRIKDGADVNSVMRDIIPVLLESVLDEELDEKLPTKRQSPFMKHTKKQRIRANSDWNMSAALSYMKLLQKHYRWHGLVGSVIKQNIDSILKAERQPEQGRQKGRG